MNFKGKDSISHVLQPWSGMDEHMDNLQAKNCTRFLFFYPAHAREPGDKASNVVDHTYRKLN